MELGHWTVKNGSGVYVMTCETLTALLTTPQGQTTGLSEATRLAKRWAAGAGRCSRIATMVNHRKSHWCAAFIDLAPHEIVFYDSLGPLLLDAMAEFSFGSLRLLGN